MIFHNLLNSNINFKNYMENCKKNYIKFYNFNIQINIFVLILLIFFINKDEINVILLIQVNKSNINYIVAVSDFAKSTQTV